MPEVIRLGDATDLVSTDKYPHGWWKKFDTFNPVQSRIAEVYDQPNNIAIAAATSAGKTVCAEMFIAHEARAKKGRSLYIGPLKALAKEKENDWTSPEHHFFDLKTAICTGDYRLNQSRMKELDESQIVVMTPEMLASRSRNYTSDKSSFLKDVGTVVFDESHLLTVPGRGDHIEVALMKLTTMNPDIRIVFLSATMPNVDECCGWISNLTGRDTYCLESTYRPVPLNTWYEAYYDGDNSYDAKEEQKVGTACSIVDYYPDDKFLIFVHTKRTGRLMVDTLGRHGITAEFHNADLQSKDREKLEDKFRNDKNFRVIVATSTLAWGLNMPARRVIITGIHRGLTQVHNYDIQQMIGRCGRYGLDDEGDAYILVPESTKKEAIESLRKVEKIKSTLLDYEGKLENPHYKTLAFHIVSEIHQGNVKTREGFHKWMNRSLAHYQDINYGDAEIDKTLELLTMYRAIFLKDGEYKCTGIGTVASMFYYSPFDVSDIKRNFSALFDSNLDNEDYAVAMALGNLDSHRWGICNREERAAMALFEKKVTGVYGEKFSPSALKTGFAYFNMMKGRKTPALTALTAMLFSDLERTMQVVTATDSMTGKWGKQDYFRRLKKRLQYGADAELVDLLEIPKVGATRAKRLKKIGVTNAEGICSMDVKHLAKVMNVSVKIAQEAMDGAQQIRLEEMTK